MCCVLLRGVASFGGYKLLIFSMLHLLQMLQGFLPEILWAKNFGQKKIGPKPYLYFNEYFSMKRNYLIYLCSLFFHSHPLYGDESE